MSIKRQATTELNHENWDQDDPTDHEEMGSFKTATKDILEKRVIRTAKRRSQISAGDDTKKSVFSGFGGFNKIQPSSFDFLSNLTNGNKNTSGSPSSKSETTATSSLFTSKNLSSSSSTGIFSIPVASTSTTKSTFGISTSQTSSLFGSSSTDTNTGQTIFSKTKVDSTVESPFKIEATSSSAETNNTVFTTENTNVEKNASQIPLSQVSSSIFGVPSTSLKNNKSLFSNTANNSASFKVQPLSNANSSVKANLAMSTKSIPNESNNKVDKNGDSKKLNYYVKLKGLNESVSDWIKKHVEETPLCILTPIFKDYEKYLKEIQDEYQSPNKEDKQEDSGNTNISDSNLDSGNVTSVKSPTLTGNKLEPSPFSNTNSLNSKSSTTAPIQDNSSLTETKTTAFSFGINTTTSLPVNTTASTEFSFGINKSNTVTTTAPFSFSTNTTTSTSDSAPFSFGIGKPYNFSSNIQKPTEITKEEKEDDEPPKVEFTPVVEENSVYDKRCKIFVKKDGHFIDKGVGTLYIKTVEESGKHQLLVRANTNLGNVLLNLILASAIPMQRMGKNNVMMVCIPTPESKPPPTPILIRVKTSEEADELLDTLNKYKV